MSSHMSFHVEGRDTELVNEVGRRELCCVGSRCDLDLVEWWFALDSPGSKGGKNWKRGSHWQLFQKLPGLFWKKESRIVMV